MADIGALILPIGADPSEFQRSINDVKDRIKELAAIINSTPFNLVTSKQKEELVALQQTLKILTSELKNFGQAVKVPENSIQGLTNKIKELNQQKILLDPGTSAAEIAKLNKQIDELSKKRDNLNNLGVAFKNLPKPINEANQSIKRTTTALTSLTLVVQDLPFGFIAIQNNLPNLIQQFGLLKKDSGGTLNAFKELGKSLVGPAGLFLAFSAVTAGITILIQKYGSLGNAINSILSGNQKLGQELSKINKEYKDYIENTGNVELKIAQLENSQAGQIETIQILTKKVTDLSLSESQRSNALDQLKKIDKDYYGSFTTSAKDSDGLKDATDRLTKSLILQAKAKGLSDFITDITKQLFALEFQQKKIAPGFSEISDGIEKSSKQIKSAGQFGATGVPGLPNILALFRLKETRDQLSEGDQAIEDETIKLQSTKKLLEETLDGITNLLQPDAGKKESPLKILPEDLDAAYNLEKIIQKLESYGNVLLDTNKPLKERKNALKEILAIDNEYFKSLGLGESEQLSNKESIEEFIRTLQAKIKWQEFDNRAAQLNAEFAKVNRKAQDDLTESYEAQIDPITKLTMANDQFGNSTARIAQNRYLSFGTLQYDINKYRTSVENLGQVYNSTFEGLKKKNQEIFESVKGFLYQPIENLFDVILTKGEKSWKQFGDAVIATLKRIAAQLIATGIAKGIANLLAPGLGSISTDALGAFLDASPFSANFGGLQGGGMAMTGQVNLTLRGADLVGSLNRTNTIINRVG